MSRPPALLTTEAYRTLGARIAASGGYPLEAVARRTFPDGEHYLRFEGDLAGRDVILVGGTVDDASTLELFDLACAAAKYQARTLTLVLPYFGYQTMERAARPGEVVTAKNRARLFSAIPAAAAGNRVLLLDLHSEGITYYFEGAVSPVHVYGKPVIQRVARRLGGDDFVLASTDAGRAKWVESLANDLGVPAAVVLKRRLEGGGLELVAMSAHVEGRSVVVYDDMVRSGGSLLQAARAYREAGAARVTAVATHGVLPGEALASIQASGLIEKLVVTDSHPRAIALESEFLEVVTVADLLAEHIGGGLP